MQFFYPYCTPISCRVSEKLLEWFPRSIRYAQTRVISQNRCGRFRWFNILAYICIFVVENKLLVRFFIFGFFPFLKGLKVEKLAIFWKKTQMKKSEKSVLPPSMVIKTCSYVFTWYDTNPQPEEVEIEDQPHLAAYSGCTLLLHPAASSSTESMPVGVGACFMVFCVWSMVLQVTLPSFFVKSKS